MVNFEISVEFRRAKTFQFFDIWFTFSWLQAITFTQSASADARTHAKCWKHEIFSIHRSYSDLRPTLFHVSLFTLFFPWICTLGWWRSRSVITSSRIKRCRTSEYCRTNWTWWNVENVFQQNWKISILFGHCCLFIWRFGNLCSDCSEEYGQYSLQ